MTFSKAERGCSPNPPQTPTSKTLLWLHEHVSNVLAGSSGPTHGIEGKLPILECCCPSPWLVNTAQPRGQDPPAVQAPLAAFARVPGQHWLQDTAGIRPVLFFSQSKRQRSPRREQSAISLLLSRAEKPWWCFHKELIPGKKELCCCEIIRVKKPISFPTLALNTRRIQPLINQKSLG